MTNLSFVRIVPRTKNRLAKLFLLITIIFLVGTFLVGFPSKTAYAAPAAGSCNSNNGSANLTTWIEYDVSASNYLCDPSIVPFNSVAGFSRDCTPNGSSYTINQDLWLTQGTVSGATRWGETGRSGWITYLSDCNFHLSPSQASSYSPHSDPIWGCGWALLSTGQSHDFICTNVNTGSGAITGARVNQHFASSSSFSMPSTKQSPRTSVDSITGKATRVLITPDGLELDLVGMEQHGRNLLFHFHAVNTGNTTVQVIGNQADFQFYYVRGGHFIQTPPIATADQPTHPALPSTLAVGASADGWATFTMASTVKSGKSVDQILYRFGAVPSESCATPRNASTCHSEEGYMALVWDL